MMTGTIKDDRRRLRTGLRTCGREPNQKRTGNTGARPPRRILFRSFYGWALACLAVVAFGITCFLGVVGCGPVQSSGYLEVTPGNTFPCVRQSPQELARVLRNAQYYKLLGRPELALKELEQAHRQNPDNLKIANILAQTYEAAGKFETARKIYQEALTRNGPNPALANNLCFTYYLQGRWQKAEACYRQALAQDPNNETARNNLGLLYCRLGRQDEARRLWQQDDGKAVAEAKIHQVLAALGMAAGPIHVPTPPPAPPLHKAPKPVQVAAVPAPSPPPHLSSGSLTHLATPPAPKKVAEPSAPKPVIAKPALSHKQLVAADRSQVKSSKTAPAPSPAAAPRATTRPHPPYLTCAELVGTPIEVRNGTRTKYLAHKMRTLLETEGFNVAKIGNHIDFGAKQTTIYYRPQARRVARALQTQMLPLAHLDETSRLNKRVDIKVLLGHDLLENQAIMARLRGDEPQPRAVSPAPPPTEKVVTSPAPAPRPAPEAAKPQKVTPPPPSKPYQIHRPAAVARAESPRHSKPLTAVERENTAIEIRNGNGIQHLAHWARSLLKQEGFRVSIIGNHIDFGAQQTIIYYRPEGKRVAEALARTLFPKAELEPSQKLHKNIGVKILLGADLLQRPRLMARLMGEGQ